jgi:hypothetical protein
MQMSDNRTAAPLTVVGKLPQGYIILCRHDGDGEYAFLVRALGISVECPHCGATRCGAEMAQEYHADPRRPGDRGAVVIPLPQRAGPARKADEPANADERAAAPHRADP